MQKKKINIKDIEAQSLAGGHILINIFNKKKINAFIDQKLGKRAPRAEYSYSDAIYSWYVTKCRGVKSFESLDQTKDELRNNPIFKKGMSPDTLLYICKELSKPDLLIPTAKSSESKFADNQINSIDNLNELLIELSLHLGILNTRDKYIIDYDTTPNESRNKDARPWYGGKGRGAYCPAAAFINKLPILIENRNGNTNPQYRLVENISKVVELLKKYNIKIDYFRIDAAGNDSEFTDYAAINNIRYITKPKVTTIERFIFYLNNWQSTKIKSETLNIGDGNFRYGSHEQRFIVNYQNGSASHEGIQSRWGLITNVKELTPKEIIVTYRNRGTSEHLFSDLNQVGWSDMRMHKFQYNTVYLYITGINAILHRYIALVLSTKVDGINEKVEFDTVRSFIMLVPVMWFEGRLIILSKNPAFKGLSGFT